MRTSFTLLALAVVASILSGCITKRAPVITDTVGPGPGALSAGGMTNGTLMVYSAYKRNADFNSIDPNRPEHSDYQILTADGRWLRRVHNLTRTPLEEAVAVELPPGKYEVVARANGYGYLTIPVLVEAHRCTALHLEGGGFWPGQTGFNPTNCVRLPDGEIIGWKSSDGPGDRGSASVTPNP